jgi:hypothetical protein
MTTRMSVTLNVGPNDGATRTSERGNIKTLLGKVIQAIGDGTSTSGTVLDNSGNNVGSWTYSPTASS